MRKEDTSLRRAAQSRALQRLLGPAHQRTVAERSGISEGEISKYVSGDRLAGEPKLIPLARGFRISPLALWEAIAQAEMELAAETLLDEVNEPFALDLGTEEVPTRHRSSGSLEESIRSLFVDSLREEMPRLLDRAFERRGLGKRPRD